MTQSDKNDARVSPRPVFASLDDERPMTAEEVRELREETGLPVIRFED